MSTPKHCGHHASYAASCRECQLAYEASAQRGETGAPSSAAEAAMSQEGQVAADTLAEHFGKECDDLLARGFHAGQITYALCAVLAITFKAIGGSDINAVKALVCETIEQIYAADDAALAEDTNKRNN